MIWELAVCLLVSGVTHLSIYMWGKGHGFRASRHSDSRAYDELLIQFKHLKGDHEEENRVNDVSHKQQTDGLYRENEELHLVVKDLGRQKYLITEELESLRNILRDIRGT